MSFDGFFTYHINNDLKKQLENGRINKIYQPSPYEIVLSMRANRQNYKLLLSIHPTQARYHLTQETFFNPEIAPNFCMLLRKHLEGAFLKDIQQVGIDRITTFIFQNKDDIGDEHLLHLTIELMGRHSNLFLINPYTNKILDCLKRVSQTKNSYRLLAANQLYTLPPYQHKQNIITLSKNELEHICSTVDANPKSIQETFQGLGRDTIQWVLDTMEHEQCSLSDSLYQLKNAPTCPSLTSHGFSCIDTTGEKINSLHELLDVFYQEKAKLERVQQLSGNLIYKLQQIIDKNLDKLNKLHTEKNSAEHADTFRIKGEILTAFSYEIPKGQTSGTFLNFYDDNKPMTITLKPELTPTQNAQYYFKKYQKLKQAISHLDEQIELAQNENMYLESVLVQIKLANTEDLVAIKEELISTGYLKQQNRMNRKQQHKKLAPLQFCSSDGISILVGRNNLQNDTLTLKQAKKTDIWLHTKDIPGSHVIIQHDSPSQDTLLEAAQIAAYYSKFQASSNVPVDYVAVKYIKKPNGAKPGFVIYENQKTLFVSPDKSIIERLKVDF
ncbi:DUF814 domain-containing protein [Granulicatella sp. zg-ZJ]|uniref:Rqc2 family fibronectin-binding protein n=1 Tax=Granulicatella sp. zg-ZJ TaxID=2678504 RepID=UPI0013D39B66|nr:NFACT RNA binding domain-containing protein [Granulicatella sp. zg-ZJ]MBS4750544.1 NFACT family protein [Carnobacteriaceae bacterium zg-ZUI78]NEW63446.1 DUF814 domain-containing protein [Granulicatella sp. zg-ZJ]